MRKATRFFYMLCATAMVTSSVPVVPAFADVQMHTDSEDLLNDAVTVGSITGTLKDADGAVKSGATVTIRPASGYMANETKTTTTDEAGSFSAADLAAGDYYVVAANGSSIPAAAKVTVAAGNAASVALQYPADVSAKIANADFSEDGNIPKGWENGVGENTKSAGYRVNKGEFAPWANAAFEVNMYQTLTDLDNGTYIVSVSGVAEYADGDVLRLYAKNSKGEVVSQMEVPMLPDKGNAKQQVAIAAKVTDGTLTIGIAGNMSANMWANIDNFKLGYLADAGSGQNDPSNPSDPTEPTEIPDLNLDHTKIVNDVFFTDTDGNPIYSQGGGIFKFGDTYYWYGVKYQEAEKYAKTRAKSDENHFAGVTCYTSKDLMSWKYEGLVVTPDEVNNADVMGTNLTEWVGRLGVAKLSDGTFALLVQHECPDADNAIDNGNLNEGIAQETDGYSKQVLALTSDSPTGQFKWNNRINMKNYTANAGLKLAGTTNSGDQTVFIDPATGKGWLLYSYGSGRSKIYLSEIKKEGNTITLGKAYMIFNGAGREGNCMFEHNGKYYVCASDLYGWNASHAYYLELDSLDADYLETLDQNPIKTMAVMDGCVDDFCHVTQTGFFYTVKGSSKETVIFCGDRWSDFADNGNGFNAWCPLSFDENGKPYFNSLSSWTINDKTGEWSVNDDNNYVKNGSFDADRVSVSDFAGWNEEILKGSGSIKNTSDCVVGKYALNMSGSGAYAERISQQIASTPYVALEDGVYTLTANVKNSGTFDALRLYAASGGRTFAAEITESHGSWTKITVDNVVVKDHAVEIGFYAEGQNGSSLTADDLTFVKNLNPQALTKTLSGTIRATGQAVGKTVTIRATGADGSSYAVDKVLTGEAASFTIPDLPEGEYAISVDGYGITCDDAITVAQDGTVSPIVIGNTTGNVTGKVVNEAQRGLAGVTVTLAGEKDTFTATTDDEGSFTFNAVPQGAYTISYEKKAYVVTSDFTAEVTVTADQTLALDELAMAESAGDILGTVLQADGTAAAGATVTVRPVDGFKANTSYTATADDAGAFSLDALPVGSYTLIATYGTGNVYDLIPAVANVAVENKKKASVSMQLPSDQTVKVANPTFDAKNLNGWTNGTQSTAGYRNGKKQSHNTYDLGPWANNDFTIDTYQTISDLEDGYYIVSAYASNADYKNDDEIYLFAKNANGDVIARMDIPASKSYQTIAVLAHVTDGTLTLGIGGHMTSGQWANIDDFHLGYVGASIAETTYEDKPSAANKSALEAAIAKAQAVSEADYTAESYAALSEKLGAASRVNEKADASQEEVDAAAAELNEAYDNLVEKQIEPVVTPANKSALETAIAKAQAVSEADYTAESYAALSEKLGAASRVNEKADASQEEVDAAAAELNEAYAALVKKPEDKPDVKPEDKPDVKPEDNPSDKPDVKPEDNPSDKPDVKPEDKPQEQPSSAEQNAYVASSDTVSNMDAGTEATGQAGKPSDDAKGGTDASDGKAAETTTPGNPKEGVTVESSVTTTEKEDGSKVEKTEIPKLADGVSATVTVQTDADGNVSEAKAEVTAKVAKNVKKVMLTADMVGNLAAASGQEDMEISLVVADDDGNMKYRLSVAAKDLSAGQKLIVYKKHNGKLALVNSKTYKVNKDGNLSISLTERTAYQLVTVEEAKQLNEQIASAVKLKKNKASIGKNKSVQISFADQLDMENVKTISYVSGKKSVASVSKNGRVTGKKAGVAIVKVKVTLKNGMKKTLECKVTVN